MGVIIFHMCMLSRISKGMFPLGPTFTEIPKEYGMSISQELLQWYQMEGNEFLWHTVVVDEMWHNPQPKKRRYACNGDIRLRSDHRDSSQNDVECVLTCIGTTVLDIKLCNINTIGADCYC